MRTYSHTEGREGHFLHFVGKRVTRWLRRNSILLPNLCICRPLTKIFFRPKNRKEKSRGSRNVLFGREVWIYVFRINVTRKTSSSIVIFWAFVSFVETINCTRSWIKVHLFIPWRLSPFQSCDNFRRWRWMFPSGLRTFSFLSQFWFPT